MCFCGSTSLPPSGAVRVPDLDVLIGCPSDFALTTQSKDKVIKNFKKVTTEHETKLRVLAGGSHEASDV